MTTAVPPHTPVAALEAGLGERDAQGSCVMAWSTPQMHVALAPPQEAAAPIHMMATERAEGKVRGGRLATLGLGKGRRPARAAASAALRRGAGG